jgi:hypothetical protein
MLLLQEEVLEEVELLKMSRIVVRHMLVAEGAYQKYCCRYYYHHYFQKDLVVVVEPNRMKIVNSAEAEQEEVVAVVEPQRRKTMNSEEEEEEEELVAVRMQQLWMAISHQIL